MGAAHTGCQVTVDESSPDQLAGLSTANQESFAALEGSGIIMPPLIHTHTYSTMK